MSTQKLYCGSLTGKQVAIKIAVLCLNLVLMYFFAPMFAHWYAGDEVSPLLWVMLAWLTPSTFWVHYSIPSPFTAIREEKERAKNAQTAA